MATHLHTRAKTMNKTRIYNTIIYVFLMDVAHF